MSVLKNLSRSIRRGYRRLFRRQSDDATLEIMETLRRVSLFRTFPKGALQDVAEVIHRRRYRRDEFIYYENDPGLGLYIVQQGRVRLLSGGAGFSVHELRQVAEYEFFGEMSILGDFRRMETAQAFTETHVLGFFSPDLKLLLKRHPQTGAAVAMALARCLATRQAALLKQVAQDEGRESALRMLKGA